MQKQFAKLSRSNQSDLSNPNPALVSIKAGFFMIPKNIKLFGFNTPPWGLIKSINQSNVNHDDVIIIEPLAQPDIPYDLIKSHPKENLRVILYTHEGASYQWFDILLEKLTGYCGVPWDRVALRSSCLYSPDSPIYHIGSMSDSSFDFLHHPDIIENLDLGKSLPKYHYCCLNRQHRWQRLRLVTDLIKREILSKGNVSYLESPPTGLDEKYRGFFPMILNETSVSAAEYYRVDFPKVSLSMFNVVTESCYEAEPGSRIEQHYLPGLGEKTYKSIVLFQIPIFLAAYHTVSCYRDLGFDVFDDVIDHSYDSEKDPVNRVSMVADQIQQICQYDIAQLVKMKTDLGPRFQCNLDLLRFYAGNFDPDIPKWQQWFAQHR
jgi:hypothetical protein